MILHKIEESLGWGARRLPATVPQAEGSDSDSSEDKLTTYINRDGTHSSATAAELKLAAALSKDPWGRFGGRAGKLARIRAQEAEALAAMQVTPLTQPSHSMGMPAVRYCRCGCRDEASSRPFERHMGPTMQAQGHAGMHVGQRG